MIPDALGERYLMPGENRRVDTVAASGLRRHVVAVAAQLGLDKVSAAVVLIDLAVELLRANPAPYAYAPPQVREVLERAVLVHFGGER